MKKCSQCGLIKELEQFGLTKRVGRSKDSRRSECRTCKGRRDAEYSRKHPEKKKEGVKKWEAKNPWYFSCKHARARCNNPNHKCYKRYGGRGIKMLLLLQDVKELWLRDRAFEMKKPSLDRVDNDKNYTVENCRFIEFAKNLERGREVHIENMRKKGFNVSPPRRTQ